MDTRELADLRSMPLNAVLEGLGAKRDPKDPARNWRYGASRITVTDSRFFDHNQAGAVHRMRTGKAGGGGAIDLVQYLKNVSLPEAAHELASLSASRPIIAHEAPARAPTRDSRPAPVPATDQAGRAHWYLTTVRGIPEAHVDEALNSGQVFSDARGNVVFRLSDAAGREIGFEVRGTSERPFHSVHGSKGLFILKADSSRIATFVESGIEAFSYRALRGSGLIVSTTGSALEFPARLAQALQDRSYALVAAFNADKAGDRLSASLSARIPGGLRRDRPDEEGRDWNDMLRAVQSRAVRNDLGPARSQAERGR